MPPSSPLTIDSKTSNLDHFPGHGQCTVNDELTIGDLHGNALKLIYTLLREGVLRFNCEDLETAKYLYQELRDIYNLAAPADQHFTTEEPEATPAPNNLTQDQLNRFIHILQQMQVQPIGLVRLIGDELADRGSNDLLTIRLLTILKEKGLKFSILLSNHSMDFILAYMEKDPGTHIFQICSYYSLLYSMQQGLVDKEAIKIFWETIYLPQLNLFDYNINHDAEPPQFTVFSHAPTGLETIRQAAYYFEVPYKDHAKEALANTINAINLKFRTELQENDTSCFFHCGPTTNQSAGAKGTVPPEAPVYRCAWNRLNREHDQHGTRVVKNKIMINGHSPDEIYPQDCYLEQPEEHHGYQLRFVNGHIGQDSKPVAGNRTNLDNNLGKKVRNINAPKKKGDPALGNIIELTGSGLPYYIIHKQKVECRRIHPDFNKKINKLKQLIESHIESLNPNDKHNNTKECHDLLDELLTIKGPPFTAHDFKVIADKLRKSVTLDGSSCRRNLKQHVLKQLSDLQQVRIAESGNTLLEPASYYYHWFTSFVTQQLNIYSLANECEYNPADGHHAYHLHAMKAILQATNALGNERELTDTLAAVDSLFNLYQQMVKNNSHWWQSEWRLPIHYTLQPLPYDKPSYLNNKQQTRVPLKYRHFSKATSSRLHQAITALDNQSKPSNLSIGQRIKRWWHNVFKRAVTHQKMQLPPGPAQDSPQPAPRTAVPVSEIKATHANTPNPQPRQSPTPNNKISTDALIQSKQPKNQNCTKPPESPLGQTPAAESALTV
ncbi:MAG: hypothetical protein P1U40_01790 [Coxiellaceae bacterium]|nr:hypothetical protein [Coxiellaceae bacterium]